MFPWLFSGAVYDNTGLPLAVLPVGITAFFENSDNSISELTFNDVTAPDGGFSIIGNGTAVLISASVTLPTAPPGGINPGGATIQNIVGNNAQMGDVFVSFPGPCRPQWLLEGTVYWKGLDALLMNYSLQVGVLIRIINQPNAPNVPIRQVLRSDLGQTDGDGKYRAIVEGLLEGAYAGHPSQSLDEVQVGCYLPDTFTGGHTTTGYVGAPLGNPPTLNCTAKYRQNQATPVPVADLIVTTLLPLGS